MPRKQCSIVKIKKSKIVQHDKDQVRHFSNMNKIVPGGLLKVKKQSLAIKKRKAEKTKAAQPAFKKGKSLIVSI